jgi:hypothetical protein
LPRQHILCPGGFDYDYDSDYDFHRSSHGRRPTTINEKYDPITITIAITIGEQQWTMVKGEWLLAVDCDLSVKARFARSRYGKVRDGS